MAQNDYKAFLERRKTAFEEYQRDLEEIKLVAPNSPSMDELEKDPFKVSPPRKAELKAIEAHQQSFCSRLFTNDLSAEQEQALENERKWELKTTIQRIQAHFNDLDFTNLYYPNWSKEKLQKRCDQLCKVAEALSAEEAVRLKRLRTSSVPKVFGGGPKLAPEHQRTLREWRQKWRNNDGFSEYNDRKMNGADKDIIHATFVYWEKVFGSGKRLQDYHGRWCFDASHRGSSSMSTSRLVLQSAKRKPGILYNKEEYRTSVSFYVKESANNGWHPSVGVITSVAEIPGHEASHAYMRAETVCLKDRMKHSPQILKALTDSTNFDPNLFDDFLEHKWVQTVKKRAAEIAKAEGKALSWSPKSKVRLTASPDDGISEYGSTNPEDWIAELIPRVMLLPEEEWGPLEKAAAGLLGTPEKFVNDMLRELGTSEGRQAFQDYKAYHESGRNGYEKFDLEKLQKEYPETAKLLQDILNSLKLAQVEGAAEAITDAVLRKVSTIANFSMSQAVMEEKMERLSDCLHNLKIVIDDGHYLGLLGCEETNLFKGNKYFVSSFENNYSTDIYLVQNLLNHLKPKHIAKDLPEIAQLPNIKKEAAVSAGKTGLGQQVVPPTTVKSVPSASEVATPVVIKQN